MTTYNDNYTKILFENERLKVSDFRLPSKCKITNLKIEHPTIRMQVDEGRHTYITFDDEGKLITTQENQVVLDKQVFFTTPRSIDNCKESFPLLVTANSMTIENVSETQTYRQIIIELLEETPKYSDETLQEIFEASKYSSNVGTELLYENRLCKVWDFYLEPGQGGTPESVHQHLLDYVFVNVAPSRLIGYSAENLTPGLFDSVTGDNNVEWFNISETEAKNAEVAHGGKNGYDDKPMREYLVELK